MLTRPKTLGIQIENKQVQLKGAQEGREGKNTNLDCLFSHTSSLLFKQNLYSSCGQWMASKGPQHTETHVRVPK